MLENVAWFEFELQRVFLVYVCVSKCNGNWGVRLVRGERAGVQRDCDYNTLKCMSLLFMAALIGRRRGFFIVSTSCVRMDVVWCVK